jgi:hypothetical protein
LNHETRWNTLNPAQPSFQNWKGDGMAIRQLSWSKRERAIARRAFDKAYERESSAILEEVRRLSEEITSPRQIWDIHDYLSEKRQETDEKYDYRYSHLILVFAALIDQGWIEQADLEGLGRDKLDRIGLILQLSNQ